MMRKTSLGRRAALLVALSAGVIGGAEGFATAAAQTAQQTYRFAIAAKPVRQGLNDIGRITGLTVVFSETEAASATGKAVTGSLTARDALARLLAGSGLVYRFTNSNTVTVSGVAAGGASGLSDGSTTLETISVEGSGETAWGPAGGLVAQKSATGTKSDTPLLETPRAINVITKEEVQARGGAQSYIDALTYTPGFMTITPANTRSNSSAYLRGFSIFDSLYLDGMALPTGIDRANPQVEPYGVERIEVLKGPASVLYGQTSPGGLVNMVSKRPLFEPLREVQYQFGSHDRHQVTFDFSDALDADRTLAYRFTGLLQDSGTQMDFVDDDRIYIAPALTFKPDEDTTLTLLGSYRKNKGGDVDALLPNAVAADIPTGRYIGEPGFDRNDTEQVAIGYDFNHRFNDVWQVTQTGRYLRTQVDYQALYSVDLTGNPLLPGEISRSIYFLDETLQAWTSDTRFQADFDTGPLTHKLVFGLDYRNQRSDNRSGYWYGMGPTLDLFHPVYGKPVPDLGFDSEAKESLRQVGLYAQEQVKWDALVLSFGGRYDWAKSVTDLSGTDYDTATSDKAFTGNIGLLYLFDNGLAPYASFAQSFQPQAGAGADKKPFEPTTGEQYEIGVKYQPSDFDALLTVSAFQLTQQNRLTADLAYPNDFFQKQVGEIRVRGLEIEGKATIDNFDLTASYTYLDSEITKDNDGNRGNRVGYVPEHTASAWLNYRFDGALEGLNLGAGVRYVGSSYGDNENTVLNGSATYLDLSAGYDFGVRNPDLEGLRLDVSVLNAADRKSYYCDGPWGCQWGKRLTAFGTLSYRW